MFESIEIRRATNGFVVLVSAQDEQTEYVFDSTNKLFRFIKPILKVEKAENE